MTCAVCGKWVPVASTGTLHPHGGEGGTDRCAGGPSDEEHREAFLAAAE